MLILRNSKANPSVTAATQVNRTLSAPRVPGFRGPCVLSLRPAPGMSGCLPLTWLPGPLRAGLPRCCGARCCRGRSRALAGLGRAPGWGGVAGSRGVGCLHLV